MDKLTFIDDFKANTGPFRDVNDPYTVLRNSYGKYFAEIDGKLHPFDDKDYKDYNSYILRTNKRIGIGSPPNTNASYDFFNTIPKELGKLIASQGQMLKSEIDKPISDDEITWLLRTRRSIVLTSFEPSLVTSRIWEIAPFLTNDAYSRKHSQYEVSVESKLNKNTNHLLLLNI